ncbi:hypothetical protein BDZ90DRAFT_230838 [Jaminaea rosea]|uniref:C3H1-type domain-containing protein n=1 Tax=Jaminaea rosea TaxID=1569628 RepID=A0A316UU66_9BASI|nr:hypothetical protein BDZ90DRAFT_230838 [Jaminaea rosea]PWN28829.1 hypothetical protein BDZ90DRAFT_230838 [Jaminaea rosea]
MPPKKNNQKAGGAGSKVTVDKTFGMKNKGGGAAQRQVKQIQQQQAQQGLNKEALAKQKKKEDEKRMKEEADRRRKIEGELFAVVQPKVPFGSDPKNFTCAYWKAGKCEKGSKCKFAHSNDPGRKTEKKDLYTDMRDGPAAAEEDKTKDTMDTWDQAKLDKVILSKHGNPKSTTDKVCKFFLQAVEDGKYGWFWECPNGGEKCMYKHRLPPGFVLKSQKKELDELAKKTEISLEEFLEAERHKLGTQLTPVTAESFAVWKKERQDKKAAEEEVERKKKEAQAAANKANGLSGREMFTLGSLQQDDEDDDGDDDFDMSKYMKAGWSQERQEEEEQKAQREQWGDDDEDDAEENGGKSADASRPTSGQASPNGESNGDGGVSGAEAGVKKLAVNGDGGSTT